MKEKNKNNVSKKSVLGLIGFILALVGYSFAGFLTLFPALMICIIALFRKQYRVFAIIGLVLSSCWLMYVATPQVNFPNPYGIGKFVMNCNSTFWLGFAPLHIKNARGEYLFFGGSHAAIYFHSASANHNPQNVIEYAEEHGWKYEKTESLSTNDIDKLVESNGKVKHLKLDDYRKPDCNDTEMEATYESFESDKEKTMMLYSASMNSFPLWIRSDCDILYFHTDNEINLLSTVFVSKDGKSVAVYYNGGR